jgi:hypothetical protein
MYCPVLIAEVALRFCEEYVYIASYRPAGDIVDLRALNYNDALCKK